MNETAIRLLDTAQDLVQTRGYHAFSYKDLAEQVGIRTASIHYHFPSKADLGRALIERYSTMLETALGEIEAEHPAARDRLAAFVALYRATEQAGRICLCGSLASDIETLSPEVAQAVEAYLERSRRFVAETLDRGREQGEWSLPAATQDVAAQLIAGLQGALLLSRAGHAGSTLDSVERALLGSLPRPAGTA